MKNPRKGIFFREGGKGEPPYPPYHKNLGCQGEIAKPGCQGKSFDANFLEKDLASLGSSAHAKCIKIDCTNYTETASEKRTDRTLNYRPANSAQADAMAKEFQVFLGNDWEVFVAGRNRYGHGWGEYEFTVYAVRMKNEM